VTRFFVRLSLVVALGASLVACGKKGPPQAPLRPIAAAVGDFAAQRLDGSVTLTFTVPATNLDGSKPPVSDRVEVYAVSAAASAPAPTREQVFAPGNLATSILLRTDRTGASDAIAKIRPGPGDPAAYTEKLTPPTSGEALVRYYGAAAIAGRRRGAVSAILAVPVAPGPSAPAGVAVDYSEREITLSWQPTGSSQRFLVSSRRPGGVETRLTPEPITTGTHSIPVAFGSEQCLVVRSVDVVGRVMLIGEPSEPQCVTPLDHFPPQPPTDLKAVPGESAVDLVWTASISTDLAGYVVLRGEGANGTLQRLTPSPVTALLYRDATVRPGVTYVYVVIAVDTANPPNQSGESNRSTATARRP
jgi:predicted small lipoprotein YifL